jgi:Flp pilus assembly protein TadG
MIRALRLFLRDRRGASAAEFALVLPLFMMFVLGIIGFGMVFWANAGLRNAVGEGARVATLFPRRSNAEIATAVRNNAFGLGNEIGAPSILAGTANGQDFVEITATISPTLNLFLIEARPLTFTERRRVYRPA